MTKIHAKIRQRLSRDLENLTSRSRNITYAQACNRNADDLPDRVAIVDRRNRLDWAAVKTQSDRLALGLMERGIIRLRRFIAIRNRLSAHWAVICDSTFWLDDLSIFSACGYSVTG